MRWDWLPLSASALVIGVMALVLGTVLNPIPVGGESGQTVATVSMAGGRWLAMSVMYFLASVTLTLGLPAVLSLFTVRARRIGVFAVGVFAIGTIGTSGYAMLLVFFQALVNEQAIRTGGLDDVTADIGLSVFLYGWVAAFYGGLVILAVALFIARRTSMWIPALLLAFVAMLPLTTALSTALGRVGQVAQVLALAFAFTGIAMAAVHSGDRQAGASTQPAH